MPSSFSKGVLGRGTSRRGGDFGLPEVEGAPKVVKGVPQVPGRGVGRGLGAGEGVLGVGVWIPLAKRFNHFSSPVLTKSLPSSGSLYSQIGRAS